MTEDILVKAPSKIWGPLERLGIHLSRYGLVLTLLRVDRITGAMMDFVGVSISERVAW
jgi:hypothetical protein